MEKDWTVDQNTGNRADLSRGLERKEVRRPKNMSVAEFHHLLTPGTTVDDGSLAFIEKRRNS